MKSHLAVSLLLSAASLPAGALDIQLNPTPGMDPQALAGFQAAASYWEAVLTDSAQVNIDIGFQTLGPGVLGQAGSTQTVISVFDYFTALTNEAAISAPTSYDNLAVGNLPTLSGSGGLSFWTQRDTENGSLTVSLDNDDSDNNIFLALNTANAKALGLYSGSGSDANITFSDLFDWDFDQSDGIGAGLQDFVGVAIHEIGHALGFTSGVDSVDWAIGQFEQNLPPVDLDEFAVYSSLDVFRYSAAAALDMSVGGNPYFSLDGGVTNLGYFSTGSDYGDGNQASHWKDGLGLGIMDPTANPAGQVNTPSELDKIAFDVIGWDVDYNAVPEPSSVLAAALGALLIAGRRRR